MWKLNANTLLPALSGERTVQHAAGASHTARQHNTFFC
jgi:hypothetical protein